MSLAEFRSLGGRFAVALAGLALPVAAQAAIVVSSSGPSAGAYPVGKKLPDTGTITLRPGDTVTVLDSKGTRVLRGAGTFAIGAPSGGNASSTFAVLTMQRSAQRVRTGAVRSGKDGTPPASPNLWFVDVTKSGKRCVVAGQPVRLWRLDTAAAATYTVKTPSGATVAVPFAAGAMVAPWDTARYPVADGATVAISLGGKPVSQITFAVLPSQPADPEAMAEALIGHGCSAQVALLSSTLAQP